MKSNEQERLYKILNTPHQFIDYPDADGCTIIHREKDPTTSQEHTVILYKNGEKSVVNNLYNTNRNDERHIIRCEDVYVVGTAVLTKELHFLPASNIRGTIEGDKHIVQPMGANYSSYFYKHETLYFRKYFRKSIRNSSIIEMNEPVFYWKNRILNHYGHYLIEMLPRIWANSILNLKGMTFLANQNYEKSTFKRDFLQPFYLNNHRCLATDTVVHCNTLYVASPLAIAGKFINQDYSLKIYATIRDFYCRYSFKKHSKIYLSRKFIRLRTITNEDEVEAFFRKCGFQIIYFEQLSITEQINSIINAEYIAGSVGTAYHNLLFTTGMEKKIFMITSSQFFSIKFYLMQNALLKHDSSTVFEETNTSPTLGLAEHASFTVNMKHLKNAVDDWLNTN